MVLSYNQKQCNIKNSYRYGDCIHNVEEITPADDAFHGSKKRLSAEWWYFDVLFTNGYSVHMGCRTFSKKKLGWVSPFLEIYKDGKLEVEKKKRFFFKNFETSKEFPLIKLLDKTIIEFDYKKFKETGEWIYKINMKIEDCEANLTFISTAKGFKIETEAESWTVASPKANVTGEIVFKDKKMKVEGVGYHDHNWNYTFLSALTYGKGWYWGKIRSNKFNIVWANVIKKDGKWDLLAVVNDEQNAFYNINPENIIFKPENYIRDHRRKTPTRFTLKINDVVNNIPIVADVEMDVKDLHYSSVLSAPYWRYHINTTGFISVDDKKETIDSMQIMEYLTFS